MPAPTLGLTHVALRVADPERSARFYGRLFGCRVAYRDPDHVEVQTPGARDVIAFVRGQPAPDASGLEHIGFRVRRPEDVARAVKVARRAKARGIRTGEFVPGQPYLFLRDPDGYEVEVWFEPVAAPRQRRRVTGRPSTRPASGRRSGS